MSEQIKVNIIGSSIGGLLAGALLAKHGFLVNVFEARPQIGGYCTCWRRGDYLFDSSIHEMNGFFPDDGKLRIFRFLGLFKRVKLLKIPSLYTSVFKDFEFQTPHSFEEFRSALINIFPEEKKGINKVLDAIKRISHEGYGFIREKNIIKAYMDTPIKYFSLIKYLFTSVHKLIWKNVKNPYLRSTIGQLHNYYSDGLKNLNSIYFSSATYSYFNESYGFSGTSSTLTNALADIIKENGGFIHTRKKVNKIIFRNKKAVGIKVNENEEYYSDLTICNSPLKYTVENLIDKKEIPAGLRKLAQKVIPSTSLFSIYVGLKVDVKTLGFDQYCYFLNDIDDLEHLIVDKIHAGYENRVIVVVGYNLDDSMAQKGKTVLNVCAIDNIRNWEKYRDNKEEYKKEKARVAEILLNRIDNRFPGFKDNIEVMEIGTPLTMEKYSNNTDGAVYGASQDILQSNMFKFPNEIKNKSLYFSGAWVNPGGGLSGVFLSANLAVNRILQKYKIKNQLDDFIYPLPKPGDNRE